MIRGYPNPPSVLQGETVRLHIASDTPLHFQIWFYRQGQTLVLKGRTETMVAEARPLGASAAGHGTVISRTTTIRHRLGKPSGIGTRRLSVGSNADALRSIIVPISIYIRTLGIFWKPIGSSSASVMTNTGASKCGAMSRPLWKTAETSPSSAAIPAGGGVTWWRATPPLFSTRPNLRAMTRSETNGSMLIRKTA